MTFHSDILLTGMSGTGKTTLATMLAQNYNMQLLETRKIAKDIARDRGYARIREWFSVHSAKKINEAICVQLDRIVANCSCPIIIDDVLNLQMSHCFNGSGQSPLIINIWIEDSERIKRIMKREDQKLHEAISERRLLDKFKLEGGIQEIIDSAKFHVENSELDTALQSIYKIMGEHV